MDLTASFGRERRREQIPAGRRCRRRRRLGSGGGRGGRGGGGGGEEEEAAGALLQGADAGAGAALPAAALPVGARAGAAGAPAAPDAHPGQDLVPEPPLQDEARQGRRRAGRGRRRRGRGGAAAAQGGGAGAGTRRQGVPELQWRRRRGGLGPGLRRRAGGSRLAGLSGLPASRHAEPFPRLPALSAPGSGLLELGLRKAAASRAKRGRLASPGGTPTGPPASVEGDILAAGPPALA